MNYIILDLEWDSAYAVKYHKFINQILQIGAVKLDCNLCITETFEETIKSSLGKKVTGRFSRLTGITTEKMQAGITFDEAVDRYNNWVGTDTVTMTWSNSDLYSIIENEDYLLSDNRKFKIEKYLDLQKYVQSEMRIKGFEDKNQISLAGAAEIFNISTDEFDLHTAKDDSLVCVKLLKETYDDSRFKSQIKDTSSPDFYKRLRFKSYTLSDINNSMIDKSQLEFNCDKCGKKTKRITKWKYKNRWFYANFECNACKNKFNGRVSFKKTYDDLIIRHKICEIKIRPEKNTDEVHNMPQNV